MPRIVLATALALAVTTTLAACDGAASPMPTPTPSPTYAVTGDGVLRIGTLVSSTSSAGIAQIAGVETAVREINAAGGYNGVPVEVYHRNSGDDAATAEAGYAELVAKGVDVVIGPSAAALVEALVDDAIAAQVPLVSAAATDPSLSALDDGGLVFRTVGDPSGQGVALASELAVAGATTVAYLYFDDAQGAALLESLTAATEAEGLTLAHSASFRATTTSFDSIVTKAAKAKPDAVVIAHPASAAEQTAGLIAALAASNLGGSALWLASDYAVNYSATLYEGQLDGAHALVAGALPDEAFAARLRQADPAVGAYRFGAEAYDATVLAALAAVRAHDDGGAAIARLLPTVSKAGIGCTSYGHCLDVLTTEPEIDYNGVSSPVNLTENGDVVAAAWALHAYATNGIATPVRAVIVS